MPASGGLLWICLAFAKVRFCFIGFSRTPGVHLNYQLLKKMSLQGNKEGRCSPAILKSSTMKALLNCLRSLPSPAFFLRQARRPHASSAISRYEAINRNEEEVPEYFNFASDVLDKWAEMEKVRFPFALGLGACLLGWFLQDISGTVCVSHRAQA